jgi:hypothetical protein
MNNNETFPTEQLIAGAPGHGSQVTLHGASKRFPSYLRLFGIFFATLISESHWGAARLSAGCCGGFPTAQGRVAFP